MGTDNGERDPANNLFLLSWTASGRERPGGNHEQLDVNVEVVRNFRHPTDWSKRVVKGVNLQVLGCPWRTCISVSS